MKISPIQDGTKHWVITNYTEVYTVVLWKLRKKHRQNQA